MSALLAPSELRELMQAVLKKRTKSIPIPEEDGRGLDTDLWQEIAALGWLSLAVPEAQGGLGLGFEHLGVLYEELGRALAAIPVLPTMVAAKALADHSDDDRARQLLTAIVAGDCIIAVAIDPDGQHVEVSGAGTIGGSIDDLLFADVADWLLLPVRFEGAMGLAVIPADAPGVTVVKQPVVDLTRSIARVELNSVPEDTAIIISMDERAWNGLLDHSAMGLACESVGAAASLFDRTIDYLKLRRQFGRPIGSFQALKHRMADWKVRIEAATVLARHCAALLDGDQAEASATVSAAKALSCDIFAGFAGDSIQLHGGIGFTWEHPCHLFLKRAKLSQQLFGSSMAHKERVARLLFDQDGQAGVRPELNVHCNEGKKHGTGRG